MESDSDLTGSYDLLRKALGRYRSPYRLIVKSLRRNDKGCKSYWQVRMLNRFQENEK
jgi:hypothetical protein